MYGETTLPGSLPAFFHDMSFNLSISTDKLETRLQPGFQRLHFSVKMAHIARKDVSLIRSKMLLFELFPGQIKVIFFYKIQWDISIRSLLYNTIS